MLSKLKNQKNLKTNRMRFTCFYIYYERILTCGESS